MPKYKRLHPFYSSNRNILYVLSFLKCTEKIVEQISIFIATTAMKLILRTGTFHFIETISQSLTPSHMYLVEMHSIGFGNLRMLFAE